MTTMANGMTAADLACSIYVRGIPQGCSEDSVVNAFAPFGDVKEVALKGDRMYAFVQFASSAAVNAAVGASVSVDGVEVLVEARQPRERQPARDSEFLYISNVGSFSDAEDLNQVLGDKVVSIELHQERAFAYAEMESVEAAVEAVARSPVVCNGQSIGIQMRRSRAPRRGRRNDGPREDREDRPAPVGVYVNGIDGSTTNEDLEATFSPFGNITGAVVKSRTDRDTGEEHFYAFVDFESMESVEEAVEAGPTLTVGQASGLVVEARKQSRRRGGGRRNNRRGRRSEPVDM